MVTRRDIVRLALALPFLGFASAAAAQKPSRFYVIGLIRNPGEYPHKADMTVGDAIDAAGGFVHNRITRAIEIIRIVDGEKKTIAASMNDTVLVNDTIAVR